MCLSKCVFLNPSKETREKIFNLSVLKISIVINIYKKIYLIYFSGILFKSKKKYFGLKRKLFSFS